MPNEIFGSFSNLLFRTTKIGWFFLAIAWFEVCYTNLSRVNFLNYGWFDNLTLFKFWYLLHSFPSRCENYHNYNTLSLTACNFSTPPLLPNWKCRSCPEKGTLEVVASINSFCRRLIRNCHLFPPYLSQMCTSCRGEGNRDKCYSFQTISPTLRYKTNSGRKNWWEKLPWGLQFRPQRVVWAKVGVIRINVAGITIFYPAFKMKSPSTAKIK